MKFSIITVCKNSEKTIENAILSVINQTYKNFEYIIIDGLSTDNTLNILEKYSNNISQVTSEADSGLYDAMNKGIRQASGDYLFFLNSDDEFFNNNILQIVADNAENSPELLYGDLVVSNKQTGSISLQKHNKLNKIYLLKNTPCQPATFYKREVFGKYGFFDTNYKIVSDHEWFLRVFLKNQITSEYLGFPVNVFNIGGLSTDKKREEKLISERNEMLNKYFTKFERISYDFISKNFRSLTTMPVLSDLLNMIFKFKIP